MIDLKHLLNVLGVKFVEFIGPILNDKLYLQWKWRFKMGGKLDLDNPMTFNEKLQWLKLYDRKPEYTMMVDKVKVKEYVAKKIGDEYIIPTIGVWDRPEDIDFDSLPNQFVLKCSHNSGGLFICKDKAKVTTEKWKNVLAGLKKSLQYDYYLLGREWPYKNVERKILAEKYMTDGDNDLDDYKIHNFNGIPKVILVCRDRFKESPMIDDFYSDRWELLDVKRPGHPNSPEPMDPPAELQEMLRLSKILSKDIPFLRVDFYTSNHKVYFGELTFFPASGVCKFEPEKWDHEFGDWIKLPYDEGGDG